jgi:hypothetical protein
MGRGGGFVDGGQGRKLESRYYPAFINLYNPGLKEIDNVKY